MTTLYLQALSATSIASSLQISEPFLVIAGYTGRNTDAVNQHILELQAHGITPPEMIPMFWTLPIQTGSFCFAKRFLAILEDRERGRNLRCDYAIDDLSSMTLG